MPDILVVAATNEEAGFLLRHTPKKNKGPLYAIPGSVGFSVDLLVTGPGILSTAFYLTRQILLKKYQLVINIGICGSLDPKLKPVKLVHITHERMGDFGIEDNKQYLDAFEAGLTSRNTFPFKNGELKGKTKIKPPCLGAIAKSAGITVQKVTGSAKSAKHLYDKYGPSVESMEGAAVFYVCLQQQINCIQVRAISNMVQVRDKKSWKVSEAINALEGFCGLMMLELENMDLSSTE